MFCLDHLHEQMQEAQQASLFINEARMVELVRNAMGNDESIHLDSPLDSVAHALRKQADGVGERKHYAAMGKVKLENIQKAMKPYTFEHESNQVEMTVKIPVPAETKSSSVVVNITKETVRISVGGHALQPAVINGKLQRTVDPASCEWHLEGAGDTRMLVLDLEKASGGLDWDELLAL